MGSTPAGAAGLAGLDAVHDLTASAVRRSFPISLTPLTGDPTEFACTSTPTSSRTARGRF